MSNCTYAPASHIPGIDPSLGDRGAGGGPRWVIGLGKFSDAELAERFVTPIPAEMLFAGQGFAGPTDFGWFVKVRWVMPPGSSDIVRVSGVERDRGDPFPIQLGDAAPVTTAVFDAAHPGIPSGNGGWAEFPSYVYFPATGCYEIAASWAGGSWRVTIPFVAPENAPGPVGSP